ncbi:MAG: hypothetical protein BWY11_02266 [Firmicutes bacterium ADurb.Bin182]|nr:MAG: hypothetical protein BWY11_02266 [Firmicutes bacterium ADurb.Bin182]
MEEPIPVLVIIIYAAAILFSTVSVFLVARSVKKSRQYVGDPSKKEVVMGFIQSVEETNWFVNNRPELAIKLMIFPMNEPVKVITVKQVISYLDILNIQPGKYVNVSYEAGTYRHAFIEGPKPFEVTGEPFDMKYFDEIRENLKTAFSLETQGKIIYAEKTGTLVDMLPVYRIRASFVTADGKAVEGDTFRICRPYLAGLLFPGNMIGIVYNKQTPAVFTMVE